MFIDIQASYCIEVCQYVGRCRFNTQIIHRVITVEMSAGWLAKCEQARTVLKGVAMTIEDSTPEDELGEESSITSPVLAPG